MMDFIQKKYRRPVIALIFIAVFILVVYLLRNALIPVVIAIVLAYLLDPVIDRMEERKINRSVAIFILAGLVVVMITLLGGFFAVQTQRELVNLFNEFPGYLEKSEARIVILVQNSTDKGIVGAGVGPMAADPISVIETAVGVKIPSTVEQTLSELKNQFSNLDPAALKPITGALKKVSASTFAFIGWMIGLVIIPVFLFYFLRDWDRMKIEVVEFIPTASGITL
jgi:predicted PurR-regulated permease PerM